MPDGTEEVMANAYLDTQFLDRAMTFAIRAHADTERRGKGFPYIIHPMETVAIVATMTNDPELLAAAVLHDTLEDTSVTVSQLRAEFGDRVADLVLAESNIKENGITHQMSWRQRKSLAVERLSQASFEGKLVAMGDKLSNLRAIASDYKTMGDALWARFQAPGGKADIGWYYQELFAALASLKGTQPYEEFGRLLQETFG